MIEKEKLSEQDISTKFITPALLQSGWNQNQIREQVTFTAGRVMVRGNMAVRVKDHEAKGGPKRADYVLYIKLNLPLAIIEVPRFLIKK
jgi:type I restriction enzyme R subunit